MALQLSRSFLTRIQSTTLGQYQPNARVNIEVDILAKHVEKLLSAGPR